MPTHLVGPRPAGARLRLTLGVVLPKAPAGNTRHAPVARLPSLAALRLPNRQLGTVLLALAVLMLLEGCATGHPRGSLTSGVSLHSRPTSFRDNSGPQQLATTPSSEEAAGAAGGFPEQTADPFQVVQEASGLEEKARHPAGAALYLEQARQLLGQLAKTPVTPRSFAPHRVLSWLLREVLEGGERVEYADLKWRAERFWLLVLARPDGYLVAALTGTPLQRMGPLELMEGEWKVGSLVVGDFYFSHGGVFYPVTEALRRADGPPLAELGLERDPLNAALDGAQDAMEEMTIALAQSILHPIRSMAPYATSAVGIRSTHAGGLLRGGVLGSAEGDGAGVRPARGALLPRAGAV